MGRTGMSLKTAAPASLTGKKTLIAVVLVAALAALGFWLYMAWPGIVAWIQVTQRGYHRDLVEALKQAKETGAGVAWGLIVLSFLYGVFHAAGPGHGKLVISTYLVSHKARLARGILISALSSLAQGVTAVVAVGVAVQVLSISFRETRETTASLETLSFALVTLVGVYLAQRALRRLISSFRSDGAADAGCGHHHHHHHHHHDPGPEDLDVEGRQGFWQMLGLIGSVGIRPCSGAILVLLFAASLDMMPAGIAAVLAMSVGTGITVSALAILAVHARDAATRFAAFLPEQGGSLSRIGDAVALTGGVIIVLLGVSLVIGSLEVSQHPLM